MCSQICSRWTLPHLGARKSFARFFPLWKFDTILSIIVASLLAHSTLSESWYFPLKDKIARSSPVGLVVKPTPPAAAAAVTDGGSRRWNRVGTSYTEYFDEKTGKILTFFDQEVGYTIGTFISQSMCAGTEGSLSQVLSHGEAKMCVEILSRKAQLKSYEVKEDSLPAWKAQLTQTFTNKVFPWRQQQMNPLQRQ